MTTDQSQSIKSILSKLEEGKKLTLSFPSPKERELFRVALYKAKREADELFLMLDPTFEIEALSFEKGNPASAQGNSMIATIQIMKKKDLPKRGYSFSIIEEEEQQPNHEHANPTGTVDSP